MTDDQGIAHHGPPIITERDAALLGAMVKWIATARAAGRRDYQGWLPSHPDIIKSRLFWRIRSGKEPLPEPPPTCFSCPWYEVVEVLEPHDIFDVHPYPKDWSNGKNLVSVGQCPYEVIQELEDKSRIVGFGRWRFRLWRDVEKWKAAHPQSTHSPKDYEAWWIERTPKLEAEAPAR